MDTLETTCSSSGAKWSLHTLANTLGIALAYSGLPGPQVFLVADSVIPPSLFLPVGLYTRASPPQRVKEKRRGRERGESKREHHQILGLNLKVSDINQHLLSLRGSETYRPQLIPDSAPQAKIHTLSLGYFPAVPAIAQCISLCPQGRAGLGQETMR